MKNGTMRPRRARLVFALLAAGLLAVVSAPSARADASGDLNGLIRGYLRAEQNLHAPDSANENADSAYFTKRRALNAGTDTRLNAIDRSGLDAENQLTFDIFAWDLSDEADELKPGVANRFLLLPLNQFDGEQIGFARGMQARTAAGFTRARDYDAAIQRMLNFTKRIDTAIARMRDGMRDGVTQPKIIVQRMIAQVAPFADGDPDDSIFMAPLKHPAPDLTADERLRVFSAYREAVAGALIPAYRRLADFLKTEYLPRARDSIGLSALPGGRAMYLHLVRSHTTSDLTPDAIHALGLADLARIENAMAPVIRATGFTGSLADFRDSLRNDPRFAFKDRNAMLAEFTRVRDTVSAHLSALFGKRPKTPLTFRFYDSFAAPDRPAAEYAPGSADGRRPGVVTLNDTAIALGASYTSEALELHEGIPGHHLQLALTAENRSLPPFRHMEEDTAFSEGWALYAETLGSELGLYTDPYQKFGALDFDAWRASRLVVDTGIHWLGWTHDQAVQFLLDHTALSRAAAEEETDRYIAIPGQALAYKIGENEFLDLKARAQQALGAKFDIRAFHDALLDDGAMPLPVLDAKMNRWIAQRKAATG
jgi:uncharacterized protein (DUF885 family)